MVCKSRFIWNNTWVGGASAQREAEHSVRRRAASKSVCHDPVIYNWMQRSICSRYWLSPHRMGLVARLNFPSTRQSFLNCSSFHSVRTHLHMHATAETQPPPPPPPLRPAPLPPDFKARVAQQFDARAPRYDVGNAYHPPLAARLVDLAGLRPGEAVLDVGCGTGLVALAAAAAVGSAGHVTGVDLSGAMVHAAAAKARDAGMANAEFVAADIDSWEGGSGGRFDAVLCSSALPFLPDIPAALQRWRGWLRPAGGRVAFNVPRVSECIQSLGELSPTR